VAPEAETDPTELIFRLRVKNSKQLCSASKVSVYVKDNGVFATHPNTISFSTDKKQLLSIECDKTVSMVKLLPFDFQEITEVQNRPSDLIYGLIDMQIKVAKPGDTGTVKLYLPEPAPIEYRWFKWDKKNGWMDYDANAVFNDARDQVTLTFVDGGVGDDDKVADTIISDPGGLGIPPVDNSSNGGGGSGCFIEASAYGFNKLADNLLKIIR
jgi:hypothetical protein